MHTTVPRTRAPLAQRTRRGRFISTRSRRFIRNRRRCSSSRPASWLRHLTYVRDLCAHHRRVYNRMMTTLSKLLDSDKAVLNTKHGGSSKRVFTSIVIVMRIFQRTWPDDWSDMTRRLAEVIDSHPGVSLSPMGFPAIGRKSSEWTGMRTIIWKKRCRGIRAGRRKR